MGIQIFCKFVAFRNVKIGSLPQCLQGKIYFFVSRKWTDFQWVTFAKVTLGRILTIEGEKVGKVSRWTQTKSDRVTQKWPKKWPFGVRKILKISTLKVVIWKGHSVTGHFSINFFRKKRMLMYKLLIINILHTSSFFSDIKIEVKVTSDRVTFFAWK